MDNVDPEIWFDVAQTRDGTTATRQNRGFLNVEREEGRKRNEVCKNFWSQRVIDPWNNLPDTVKQAVSLDIFKNSIDNVRKRETNGQR